MNYRTCPPGELLTVVDDKNNLQIHGSAYSSVGMVRGNNEDNVELWALDNAVLALVADGMGGAAAGEEASKLAVQTVQSDFVEANPDSSVLAEWDDDALGLQLRAVLGAANRVVWDAASQNVELQGMGSTATMVLIRGMEAVFAHIGDSRAYVIEGDSKEIQQVTSDHSFVQALVASGHLTQEQAEVHPLGNVLYRALGQKDDAAGDVDVYHRRLKMGDRIILCSDGLTRHLRSADIARIALGADDPKVIARQLIDLANSRGGEDNVSAVVLLIAPR